MSTVATGSRLGRFFLKRLIARGGEGEVFLASDVRDHTDVAVKVVRAEVSTDSAGRAQREASVIASLSHPNIVKVLALGQQKGIWYIAMEYVDGGSMSERVQKLGPFEPSVALRLAADGASALHAAHQLGILHRDVAPKNMLFDTATQSLRLVDFGLCQLNADGQRDRIVGTPQYIAPEVWTGESVTPKADVYALGLSLYFLLVGRSAVRVRDLSECRKAHTGALIEAPAAWPKAIIQLFRDSTAHRPEDRISALDFARRAAAILSGGAEESAASRDDPPMAPIARTHVLEALLDVLRSGVTTAVLFGCNLTARSLLLRDVVHRAANRVQVRWCGRDTERMSELTAELSARGDGAFPPLIAIVELQDWGQTASVESQLDELSQVISGAGTLLFSADAAAGLSNRWAPARQVEMSRISSKETAKMVSRLVQSSLQSPLLVTADALMLLTEAFNGPGPSVEKMLRAAEARRVRQNRAWLGSENLTRYAATDIEDGSLWPDPSMRIRLQELRRRIGSSKPVVVLPRLVESFAPTGEPSDASAG